MSIPYSVTRTASVGGTSFSTTSSGTCDAGFEFSISVPHSTTNQLINDFAFLKAKVQVLAISVSSAAGTATPDLTLKTNSTSSPADTITVEPEGYVWNAGGSDALILAGADPTSAYVSNADGVVDAVLNILVGLNA